MQQKEDKQRTTKEYWQQNVESFGKFYSKESEEKIIALKPLAFLYRTFIFPLEKRLVLVRYRKVANFIENNVKPNMRAVDLGCGTGIFTTELLLRGAYVLAVDYVEAALRATRKRVEEMLPEAKDRIEYVLLDVMEKKLPESDIVIAIGVAPYVDSLEIFLGNILPTTNKFYCLFLNKHHWINRIRNKLTFLNVRQYRFFNTKILDETLSKHSYRRISRDRMATGFLDEMQKIK